MTDDPNPASTGQAPEGQTSGGPHKRVRIAGAPVADSALAAFWVLLGALILIESPQIKLISVQDPLGPRLVPRIIAFLLVVLGVTILIDAYRRYQKLRTDTSDPTLDADEEKLAEEITELRPSSTKRGLVFVALSLGFVVLLPFVGYIPATFVGALAMMLHLRHGEHPIILTVWSGVLAYGTFWIFTEVLNVQLPTAALF